MQVVWLILALGGVALCAEQTNLVSATYVMPDVLQHLALASHIDLYKLSEVPDVCYFDGGTRTGDYPVVGGAISYTQSVMRAMLNIVSNEDSYSDVKLGCWFPCWDSMLVCTTHSGQMEVLMWFRLQMVLIVRNRLIVGGGFLGNAKKEFVTLGEQLFPRVKGAEGGGDEGKSPQPPLEPQPPGTENASDGGSK